MYKKTIQIMIQPGNGRDDRDVDANQTLQEFVNEQGLQHHQISVNGHAVQPASYAHILMGSVDSLWAAQPVKGA